METGFCLDALDDVLRGGVVPGIFNTDHVSQFTSATFTRVVMASGAQVSMNGVGHWRDNWPSMGCGARSDGNQGICMTSLMG